MMMINGVKKNLVCCMSEKFTDEVVWYAKHI